jgi:RimJ/RimL family protein N-acetyltransferase
MNMDPAVRKYFPGLLTRDESKAHIVTIEKNIEQQGYGLFAAEWKETGAFLGFIGFSQPGFTPSPEGPFTPGIEDGFTPVIEIGWRISSHYWGRGLATEGALACLHAGFHRWGMDEIYSFTSIHNHRSEKLMIRVGMTRQGNFPHPSLPPDHWLSEHVLYKSSRPQTTGPA